MLRRSAPDADRELESQQPPLTRHKSSRMIRPERSVSIKRQRPMVAIPDTRPLENFSRSGVHHLTQDYNENNHIPPRQPNNAPAGIVYSPETTGEESCWAELRHPWRNFVTCITCCVPSSLISRCGGMHDKQVQHAWREKLALIFVILGCCALLAFLTFGLQASICDPKQDRFPLSAPPDYDSYAIRGDWFHVDAAYMTAHHSQGNSLSVIEAFKQNGKARDVTPLFSNSIATPTCDQYAVSALPSTGCTASGITYCHQITYETVYKQTYTGTSVSFEWDEVKDLNNQFLVYNGIVLDLKQYIAQNTPFLGATTDAMIKQYMGTDATLAFTRSAEVKQRVGCLVEKYQAGYLSKQSRGCFASQVITVVTLIIILLLVFVRFLMAVIFAWLVAPNLSSEPKGVPYLPPGLEAPRKGTKYDTTRSTTSVPTRVTGNVDKDFQAYRMSTYTPARRLSEASNGTKQPVSMKDIYATYIMMLVTCYSEDEAGMRTTLESLAATQYNDNHKMIFMVADGIVTGGGNEMSTPDICLKMLNIADWSLNPEPMSYIAVADGSKQHNMAKVYAGTFDHDGHSVPTVLIIKCGTPLETKDGKPGNRGKRDSQIILMNFLSKVMFNDRMTALEYDLFNKMCEITGVTPDRYEIVLMVDADTKVMEDSVPKMVNTMKNNTRIMGLCGETRIANKWASWVTAIQVYEYFVSHHLAKSFESMFGGVTCLPGCFSMYRIKSPKGPNGFWVPILANPDIIEEYSQNVTQTLHTKNLLLLGEDRFLTTLMLKTFPKRQMMFLPSATCKTVVPDTFKVLLSQRRRWINSTVHNLMELVLVKDLCGTFCFSMQFVVALELFGTIVLPAALIFTGILIYTIANPQESFVRDSLLPFGLLCVILFLPAVLILFTSRRWIYIFWMFVYLFAMPVWNFVLPVYAFWHFDDFSWGKTREVSGETKEGEDSHGKKFGQFDPSEISLKHWHDWEAGSRKKHLKTLTTIPLSFGQGYQTPPSSRPSTSQELNSGYATDSQYQYQSATPQLSARHANHSLSQLDMHDGYMSESSAYPMQSFPSPPPAISSRAHVSRSPRTFQRKPESIIESDADEPK